ncbi:MAG: phosphoglycerate mutase family protein [Calothrix sp. MO_167.B12]|nr:phosphoglycerate mutase family protein [Calothrix sp. MO_167.B12]
MRKICIIRVLRVLFLITLLASFFITAPEIALAQSPEVTTVFIVRHAEKDKLPCTRSDPSCEFECNVCLSSAGRARAEQLVHVLAEAKINAIYSTKTHRTKETAEPLLDFLKSQVPQVRLHEYESAQEVAEKVQREHAGQRLLIVSHSGMVENIIEQLNGDKKACPIGYDYDNLCVVIRDGSGETETIHLHYGTPSPRISIQ